MSGEADVGNDEPFRVAAVQMDIHLGAKDDRVEEKHWIDRFADRRPELYGLLVEPTVATRTT